MENLIYNNIWKLPNNNNNLLNSFYNYFNVDNFHYLKIEQNFLYKENDCHNNVNLFLSINGYDKYGKVLGYYLLENDKYILAVQHSVIIELNTERLIDITPCIIHDTRLFIYNYKLPEYKGILYNDNKIITKKTKVLNIDGYFL